MVGNWIARFKNYAVLSLLLPFVYGCQGGGGGGGGSAASGLLPVSDGGSGISGLSGLSGGSGDPGTTIATIHNPEPATMLLIGGGLMAMRYYKTKKR